MLGIPEDLFADSIAFFDTKELLGCELVCRRLKRIISYRKYWRFHFECRVHRDHWCWPRGDLDRLNWKLYYYKYEKEINVRQSLHRNVLSGRFVWRSTRLWDHLVKPLDTCRSRSFYLGRMENEKLKWKILFQRLVRDHRDHLGIFLQQKYKQIRCFFSIAVLGDDGLAVSSHSCPKHFQGGRELDHSTCGWLFSLESLAPVLSDGRQELVVEVDLTVFPNELDAVIPLFQLINKEDTSEELRRVTVSSLGDFVTHFAPNPAKAKQYLQELHGGPLPLIDLLDNPKSKAQIRSAAAGALWNILDTSKICISPRLVARMVNAACASLHNLFKHDPGYCGRIMVESSSSNDLAIQGPDTDGPDLAADEDMQGPRGKDLRDHLVNALTGLMWNIPIVDDFRKMMASNRYFFAALFTILATEDYSRTHFTCLHLISTLHHYGYMPRPLVPAFRALLADYIAAKEGRDGHVSSMEVGVLLSLRDVADFFVPLLLSTKLECVTFGQWCMELFYFKTPVSV